MAKVEATALPFEEAIRFFRAKTSLPTETWRDLQKQQHDRAFVVAGATKAGLLADLRGAVDKAIADGGTLEAFRKDFDQIVARHGWKHTGNAAWRSKVIFDTNIRTAYAAGRFAQMTEPAFLERNPYWEWRHGGSVRPRPQHLAWNGMVLPASDPFWQTHYPPCAFGCQCRVGPLSKSMVERRGLEVLARPPRPLAGPGPGEVLPGVSEGWDYAPGASVREQLVPQVLRQAQRHPERIRQDLAREIEAFLGEAPAAKPSSKALEGWMERPSGNHPAAPLGKPLQKALQVPAGAIQLSPETLAKQQARHPEITPGEYRSVFGKLGQAEAYQDGTHKVALIVLDQDRAYKVVLKATQDRQTAFLVSLFRVDAKTLRKTRALPRV